MAMPLMLMLMLLVLVVLHGGTQQTQAGTCAPQRQTPSAAQQRLMPGSGPVMMRTAWWLQQLPAAARACVWPYHVDVQQHNTHEARVSEVYVIGFCAFEIGRQDFQQGAHLADPELR